MKFSVITCSIFSLRFFLGGIAGFLGVIYLCFVGVWNWVSVFFISLWILY
jgi:hypothetical protein